MQGLARLNQSARLPVDLDPGKDPSCLEFLFLTNQSGQSSRSVSPSFSMPPGFVPPLLSPQLNHLTDGAITSIVWNGGSEESSVGRNGGTLSLSKQEFKFPMLAFFESINFELTHLKK